MITKKRSRRVERGGSIAAGDAPFFLYFPWTAPHKPVAPKEAFAGSTGLGPYADFIVQVDAAVGRILNALNAAGVANDTLVVFTSDNGSFMYRETDEAAPDHVTDETIQKYRPEHRRPNYIYRGTKADIWEAGHRVPFLVRWPGRVEAGSVSETPVCQTDLFATFAEMVGSELPPDAAEDSFSFLALIRGDQMEPPRPPIIRMSGGGMLAIRDADWKLVLGNGSGGRERPAGTAFERPYQLFNVALDPEETRDVIGEEPEITARLERAFTKIDQNGRSR